MGLLDCLANISCPPATVGLCHMIPAYLGTSDARALLPVNTFQLLGSSEALLPGRGLWPPPPPNPRWLRSVVLLYFNFLDFNIRPPWQHIPQASPSYDNVRNTTHNMEEALKQLEQFAANTDEIGRQNLRSRLRKLADSTEGVITTIDRIGHRVRKD